MPPSLYFRVIVHILHDGQIGKLPTTYIKRQIEVMNSAFAGTECDEVGPACDPAQADALKSNIHFELLDMNYVDNSMWHRYCKSFQNDIVGQLSRDTTKYINLYFCDTMTSLGWTYFPWSFPEGSDSHAIFINYRTLPNYQPEQEPCTYSCKYNQGYTAVHEVRIFINSIKILSLIILFKTQLGHFLGLYHTFTNTRTCNGADDGVDDTPRQAVPGSTCERVSWS